MCYTLVHNLGWAIVLFTFCSKVFLFPVSLWTHFNSIKMVKIQPDINFVKAKYYGQNEVIAEEIASLQKQQKYHPLLSTVPMIIQLILLISVINVIKAWGAKPDINLMFAGFDLSVSPNQEGISYIWVPLLAGMSAWILCVFQNAINVLQSEQSKYNQYGTMLFSVLLSLYLGWFVSLGTALYWVCSNLMTVLQLFLLNALIPPKNYVDYHRLEQSRKALESLMEVGKGNKDQSSSENRKRERRDYKRFFSVLNKHLVFYSESSGFYKYFKGYITYILDHTNLTIHYITSDPHDQIFEMEKATPRIRAYYIGENRLITLMMKMDADLVVMTMPDLNNYHIKKSMVRKDVEYCFVQHDMNSHSMLMRKGCVDHFDTVFCTGPHQYDEIRETEAVYHLPEKNLVKVGYPLIDEIRSQYAAADHQPSSRKKILIAPSWQPDNIIDSCLEVILDQLSGKDYQVIVRPHPQEVRMKNAYMSQLKKKYQGTNVEIQTDFSSNNPIMEADVLITDWSGICWEYAFTTYRPVLFVDTPMKIMNPDYQDISLEPINITLRDQLGKNLKVDELPHKLLPTIAQLLQETDSYREKNQALAEKYIYNLGTSAEVGGRYIVQSIKKSIQRKGNKQ